MTDHLLQRLEEKMVRLLTELDQLRSEAKQLKQENNHLRVEHANHLKKVQEIISLLESLESPVAGAFIMQQEDEFGHA